MCNFWFEPAERFVIEWNGSATFNVYQMINTKLKAIDCFTVYDINSIDEAYKHAKEWVAQEYNGEHK